MEAMNRQTTLIHPEDHCSADDRKFALIMLEPKIVLDANPVCEEFATLVDGSPVLFEAGQVVADALIAERKAASAERKRQREERAAKKREAAKAADKARAEAVEAAAKSAAPVKLRLIQDPVEAQKRLEERAEKRRTEEAAEKEARARVAAEFQVEVKAFLEGEVLLDMHTYDQKDEFYCRLGQNESSLCDRVKRGLASKEGGFILTEDPLTKEQVILPVCGFHFKAADEAHRRSLQEHPERETYFIALEDLGMVRAFLDDGYHGLKRLRDQRRSKGRGPQGPGGGQRGPKQEAQPKVKSDDKKDPAEAAPPKPPSPEDVAREGARPEAEVESRAGVTAGQQAEIDALNAPKKDPSRTTLGDVLGDKLSALLAPDGSVASS